MNIYLIDDNVHNQMQQNYNYDVLDYIHSLNSSQVQYLKSIKNDFVHQIKEGDIVLIHESFPNKELKEAVQAIASSKASLVVFSNKITATEYETKGYPKLLIKKDRMYHNFRSFITHFLQHKTFELELLNYGSEYEVEKVKLIRDRIGLNLADRIDYKGEYLIISDSNIEKDLKELINIYNSNGYFFEFDTLLEDDDIDYYKVMDYVSKICKTILK